MESRRAPGGAACLWLALLALVMALAPAASAAERPARTPTGWALLSPCDGNCGVAFYTGPYVEDSMADVLVKEPSFPTQWEYVPEDRLLAVALSRYAGTVLGRIDIEPEIGFGQRIGRQNEWEVWAAVFGRYRGFPWDHVVTTTVALSTGLNVASAISDVEAARDSTNGGEQVLHFFSPEITFSLPDRPEVEMLFRFHHRSGVFGLVSQTRGGAQYGTFGLRWRF